MLNHECARAIVSIHFHTVRHWKATITYHKTKDILYVKKFLGHKSTNSTLFYTQLISFEGDEYDVKVAEQKRSGLHCSKHVSSGSEETTLA